MDRTAGDGRGVLVNVALVWLGFRGWGLARPGVEAATEKRWRGSGPRMRFDGGRHAARLILPQLEQLPRARQTGREGRRGSGQPIPTHL